MADPSSGPVAAPAHCFPVDITIEDAREAVKGRIDFKEQVGPDYVSFIYFTGMAPDIFPDPETAPNDRTRFLWKVRRELRGLIFSAKDGKVISRRFHKFFNIGELPESLPSKVDLSKPFTILEKLDGSMIAPFYSENELRFCTKAGVTDTGQYAEDFVTQCRDIPYKDFSAAWIAKGYSPLYEFCSPKQRIVLEYPEDCMRLLALRNISTGDYLTYPEMKTAAAASNIPVVKAWSLKDFGYDTVPPIDDLLASVRSQTGVEGFVLRFCDGQLFKIKTKWYFTIHRSTQFLKFYSERHIWEAILKDTYDDVKAFLPPEYRQAIDNFAKDLLEAIKKSSMALIAEVRQARKTSTQAEFGRKVLGPCTSGLKRKFLKWVNDVLQAKSEGGTVPDEKIEVPVADVVQLIAEEAVKHLGSKKSMKVLDPFTNGITYETYRPKGQSKDTAVPDELGE